MENQINPVDKSIRFSHLDKLVRGAEIVEKDNNYHIVMICVIGISLITFWTVVNFYNKQTNEYRRKDRY
jgi:hypothetical protein